jgi:hypothetical protein
MLLLYDLFNFITANDSPFDSPFHYFNKSSYTEVESTLKNSLNCAFKDLEKPYTPQQITNLNLKILAIFINEVPIGYTNRSAWTIYLEDELPKGCYSNYSNYSTTARQGVLSPVARLIHPWAEYVSLINGSSPTVHTPVILRYRFICWYNQHELFYQHYSGCKNTHNCVWCKYEFDEFNFRHYAGVTAHFSQQASICQTYQTVASDLQAYDKYLINLRIQANFPETLGLGKQKWDFKTVDDFWTNRRLKCAIVSEEFHMKAVRRNLRRAGTELIGNYNSDLVIISRHFNNDYRRF